MPPVEQSTEKFPLERLLVQGLRAGIYVVVLVLALLHHFYQRQFLSWEIYRNFLIVAAAGLALPVFTFPYLHEYFKRRWLVAFSFLIDVLLVSTLLVTSRLNQSIFLFFYLILIILAGLVFQTRGAFLLALLVSICSTTVILVGEEIKTLSFFFLLVLNNVAFFSVAWISGFLAEQLELQGLNISDLRRLNQTIVETIPSGLITTLESGEVIQFNHGAEIILGDRIQVGKRVQDFLPPGTLKNWPQLEKIEVRFAEDQEVRILTFQMIPQVFDQRPTYLVVIEDETQMKRLEFAVRQSEKLAAVGQLAAGIAHEIRNPLAGISGSVQLLSQQHNNDDDRRLTRIILREIDRLNNLVSEFLDFAKPDKPPVDEVNLAVLLKEVMDQVQLQPQLRQGVEQVRRWPDEIWVIGHRDQLKQAFLNIVINAYQAMASTSTARLSVEALVTGDQLKLCFTDTGGGMDEKTRLRIFEPFMTTKPKGTGLGLAITYKILQAHRARIFVESVVGQGSSITIELPVLSRSVSILTNKAQ